MFYLLLPLQINVVEELDLGVWLNVILSSTGGTSHWPPRLTSKSYLG